ncbi:MAG TPA: energy-coupling factor transporter ATPase [Clostridia bacterium]|nr:energy-coupling factor transporter ATPase [Clostridia bacterium]
MNETLIEFKNVSFTYESEEQEPLQAVKNINFSVRKGEFVAVLGHNGSGKSTVAKLTNAMLTPERGDIIVNGMNTRDEELTFDIRKTVGMVFQNPDNQIVATIVEDDVAFGPENLGVEPKEIRRRVDLALKTVGMYDCREREPHKLSGGQKQRVAIAGVIAMQNDCLVLDEATAMLDPRGRKEVMKTVKSLNKESGKTIIFITHFMDEAVQADRVIVMNDAEIMLDGEPHEVFAQTAKIKKAGLDVPQSAELSLLLEKDGFKFNRIPLSVDECVNELLTILEVGG